MTKSLRIAALILASALLPATAHAQANCDWYAKTALKQQQDNERLKCGFAGPAWTADLKSHLAWCGSVSPDEWKKQARDRDQQLATCAKK